MIKNNSYNTTIKVQLKMDQLLLLLFGAYYCQQAEKVELCQTSKWCLENNEPLMTYHGAKVYKLGGGWWKILGYGYPVKSAIGTNATMQVDVRDDLRMLGFAV